MGYTHYFSQTGTVPTKEWNKITRAAKVILKEYKSILAGSFGDIGTKPIVNENDILFNGIGDDSHETLHVARIPKDSFNFCKTARKPYDEVVVKVLQTCKDIAPDCFSLSSDGDDIFN